MSEAELHTMRAPLRGGTLNAARRGELKIPLPVGPVYDPLGDVVLDPDPQVRHSLRLLFDTFTRTGSANATVKHFNQGKLLFPHRPDPPGCDRGARTIAGIAANVRAYRAGPAARYRSMRPKTEIAGRLHGRNEHRRIARDGQKSSRRAGYCRFRG